MGFSFLTRYNLFMESGNLITNDNSIVRYKDYLIVRNMYYDSAHLIMHFEDIINSRSELPRREEYLEIFHSNAETVENKSFANEIEKQIQRQMDVNTVNGHSSHNFKTFFRLLLKAIAEYQEDIINANYVEVANVKAVSTLKKRTFLSYAYYDKGLTQALFYYFWLRSGFLYVNWMWEGVNKNGSTTKEQLEDALRKSDQFLFLRTTNSELRMPGSHFIRQWCAWEMGNYYTKNKREKYYTSFYDKNEPRNDLLDSFKPMREVVQGEIQY
ncbi:hypothetical protein SAMN02745671_02272 [Anaerovibrio lipolyticus DSM 3074]|uniref:Uncharacterized protein n=3 Tax=Anaerovibrio lipolyticus TaxID=82374 RepID=A0A0B2JZM3_9FIRM|nr:hypothetical protein NZ47_10600 [Anaerovibrio lipolyticus]SHI96822.1 hypothetical protein SAMN02745671_02272 [Anaerovibrio lipolyticus DSM 3074]